MKTRTLTLGIVLALAVAAPVAFMFLVPGDHSAVVHTVGYLLIFTGGVVLLTHALFQRIAQRGPWDEFGANLLRAVGFLVIASPFIVDVPVHGNLGMTLTLAGFALLIVGIFWGARLHHDRRVAAS